MTQFVYLYFAAEEIGFELRHSLRSVCKNFQGEPELLIIGDEPPFLDRSKYKFIPVPRFGGEFVKEHAVQFDQLRKYEVLANHEWTKETFINMNDDFFMVKPFTEEWVSDLRHTVLEHWGPNNFIKITNNYVRAVSATRDYLRAIKRPTWNFNLHMPRYFHKKKLFKMFQEVPMIANRLHWETYYANSFLPDDFKPRFAFKGDGQKAGFYGVDDTYSYKVKENHTYEQVKEFIDSHMMLNFDNAGNHPFLEKYVKETFSVPSRWEKPEEK